MKKDSFIRNVSVIAGGSGMAQALTVLASPILTRLYTPEDFGLFAVVMAVVASLLTGATGRYETAMVLPKTHSHGVHLLGISIYFSMVFCSLLFILFLSEKDTIISMMNIEEMGDWVLIVPVMLFVVSITEILCFFANRNKQFSKIGYAAVVRSISIVTVNIAMGLYGADFTGLLLGNLVGYSFASIFLLYVQRNTLSRDVLAISKRKRVLTLRYLDYPLYNASSGILNGIRFNMPILFLMYYFPESVVGYFALLMRVAYVPLFFLATAISHVNLRKIVELINSGSAVSPYIYRITLWLCVLAIAPACLFAIWAPELFEIIFGKGWYVAGEYLQILTAGVITWFIVTSLSLTLDATENNIYAGVWKTTAFITTLAVYIWFAPRGDITQLLTAHVVNDVLLYLFHYILIVLAARNPKNPEFSRHSSTRIT